MNLLKQYLNGTEMAISAPLIVNHEFIVRFVDEYRELLKAKQKIGLTFLEEAKILSITFTVRKEQLLEEDFDLTFLSYLTLLKNDFANIDIEIQFPDTSSAPELDKYYYQLNQHRLHLLVNARKEVFRLSMGGTRNLSYKIGQSSSYIPPIVINDNTLVPLFRRKEPKRYYAKMLSTVITADDVENDGTKNRNKVRDYVKAKYVRAKGSARNWGSSDLSALYLLEALFDLYILRHVLNIGSSRTSNYQIGVSLRDRDIAKRFRETIFNILEEEQVLNFSDVECYIFSLLVRKNQLFQIPVGLSEMLLAISPMLEDQEISLYKENTKALQHRFIECYADNLKMIIRQAKDLVYGLEELSKNIVEHTDAAYGIVTGRVFSYDRLIKLKSVAPEWIREFTPNHDFLDINVIDSGLKGIRSSYEKNLGSERSSIEEMIKDEKDPGQVQPLMHALKEYGSDIDTIGPYSLDRFFNFDSVTLIHQINRTKARLGLLIFSQTVLSEKRGFANIASNDLVSVRMAGFMLHAGKKSIESTEISNPVSLGTNYNFIIPLNDGRFVKVAGSHVKIQETSTSSSVFRELHSYEIDNGTFVIKKMPIPKIYKNPFGKYGKQDFLKSEIGMPNDNEIILLDALELETFLENSSDWVRFLANLQFGANFISQLIIINMDPQLYTDVLGILKIFDRIGSGNMGFWKDARFVLFFLPVEFGNQVYWFNNLLCASKFDDFVKINGELDHYHLNLIRLYEGLAIPRQLTPQAPDMKGILFSKTNKLLNFELLIRSGGKLTLFEQTARSLLNVHIKEMSDETK